MATVSQTSNAILIKLGLRLRQVRLEQRKTLAQFAEELDLSFSTLRSMERGCSGISIGRWAEVLGKLNRLEELDLLVSIPPTQTNYLHQSQQRRWRTRLTKPRAW